MCSPSFHDSRGSNFTLIRIRVQKSNPRWHLRWDRWFQVFAILPPIVNKETSLWKVSTTSFRPVDIKSQSYREFMELFFFVNAFSHVSLKITRTGAKDEKEKRGFPFDPCFLIGWCVLTVDSSKVLLHTRVLHRVILRAILCGSDTTDYLDCDKLTTMNKVCFLIVFGIGVQQVSENLFVRILFAELHRQTTLNSRVWVEYTCITYDTPPTRPRFITNFLNY